MQITVLKSKISYATITHTELYYVGSITIDEDLMAAANLRENERVQVVNLNNGERLETYVIKGERGSNVIGLNGPAARKGMVGDQLFILSYAMIDSNESLEPLLVDLKEH
ncbi:MAG: aspartate 1-decarboxylase [Candidatus Margulisiibacteriota bacterium]|jgi:aspartate 1-decarboxylase